MKIKGQVLLRPLDRSLLVHLRRAKGPVAREVSACERGIGEEVKGNGVGQSK